MSRPMLTPNEEKNLADHIETNPLPAPPPTDEFVQQQVDAVNKGVDVQLKSELDRLTVWQAIVAFRKTSLICLIAGFFAITDGYQNQMASSIIANLGFVAALAPPSTGVLDSTWVSTYGGLFSAGQVIGQFSIQWASELLGRKGSMWCFTLLLIIAAIVESITSVWWHWSIAKFIGGIGIGAVQATLPVYINEHAPGQIRGFLIVAYSLWFSFGGLIASIALKASANVNAYSYKPLIYSQFGLIGLSILLILILPESPWWLASKGRMDKARKILEYKYANVEGYDIERELGIIAATIEIQKQWDRQAKAEGFFAIFKGLNGKRFLIGSWPKQFVGLSVFSSYSAYFFSLAGNKDTFLVTVILGCVGLAAVIFDALLVDKIGRRRMTLIGFSGACFGVTLMAIIGCFDYANSQLGAVLVFAGVVANFFNTFQSSTSYAYLTEMPEQRFKARATGWGLAYCNLYAVLLNFTVPLMLKVWVVKTAFLFVGLGIPGTILAYFIMPESMQRSPAEIQELFVDHVPLRKWRGYKTSVEKDLELRMGITGA